MLPSEIRKQIRLEHEYILMLVRKARANGTASLPDMSRIAQELITFLVGHIHREEEELVPHLRDNTNWSEVNEKELRDHHASQRNDFHALSQAIEAAGEVTPSLKLRFEGFLDEIEKDVNDENVHLLTKAMLHDEPESDGFGA